MACGTPVLISNRVNIWREVEADGAGLVEPDTVAGAKALLGRFAAMPPENRAAMGTRARACFLGRFQVDRAASNLMALIESQIASTGKTARNSPA
jgi:glycosyltransferase involved in cell wall biosynthesis